MKANDREPFKIREATWEDLQNLEWEGEYRHFRRLYRRAMEEADRGRRILLVAESDAGLVGQIFIQLTSARRRLADGHKSGYLYSFRVRPEYRNKGIGSYLLQAAESILRERGYQRSVISVAKNNSGARRLYERCGYRIFSEDSGEWSYVNHVGELQQIEEPSYLLEKSLHTESQVAESDPP